MSIWGAPALLSGNGGQMRDRHATVPRPGRAWMATWIGWPARIGEPPLFMHTNCTETAHQLHRNRTPIADKLEDSHLSHQSNIATGPRAWGADGRETVAERK